MFTEQELLNGEVKPSDDMEGMSSQIDMMWDEVGKKRTKVFRLFEQNKSEEALQLRETANEMQKELDSLVKSFMTYQKYLQSVNKGKGKIVALSVAGDIKNQKSSNGTIVQEIPKH